MNLARPEDRTLPGTIKITITGGSRETGIIIRQRLTMVSARRLCRCRQDVEEEEEEVEEEQEQQEAQLPQRNSAMRS